MQTNNNINLNKIVLISPSELAKKVSINIANQTPRVQFKSDQLLINNNKGIPALTGLTFWGLFINLSACSKSVF